MKFHPLVLTLASAGLGLLSFISHFRHSQKYQTANVNAMPLRVTMVSSTNQIGHAGKFFEDSSARSICSRGGSYHIQVNPPIEAHHRLRHSKSSKAIEIANCFKKLLGLEPIKAHAAIEHHTVHGHFKFVSCILHRSDRMV